MRAKTNNWDDLRYFLAVARDGGLSVAARSTGTSAATLGRRMLALEQALDSELFIRHGRGYELTRDGLTLQAELAAVESAITQATAPLPDQRKPLVKISAGTWTTLALLENLNKITGTPADVRLRFVSAEDILDIAHREVAIGFRNQRPTETSLAGKKLMRVEFAAYATPDAPEQWIRVVANTPSAQWLDRIVGKDAICEVNTPRNSLDLAMAGVGTVLLPTFIGDQRDDLERRGSTIAELAHDQWIVTHQDDRHLPQVRRTINRLTDLFGRRTKAR